MKQDQIDKFNKVYDLFFHPGEVVEIRAFGLIGKDNAWGSEYARRNNPIFGYFDNAEDFSNAAAALNENDGNGIYFTLNPVINACVNRANNRLVCHNNNRKSTSDSDTKCIRWFFIDLDPVRPSGISSTEEELNIAKELGKKITTWLQDELKFPKHIGAMSGNGYHIIYRLDDLPNTDEISKKGGLIERALTALSHKFSNNKVKIDRSVFNAAQLGKLYGTVVRKGDSSNDRPHRESYLFKSSHEKLIDVPVVTRELLEKLASMAPDTTQSIVSPKNGNTISTSKNYNKLGQFNAEAYLRHYGIETFNIKKDGIKTIYNLKQCLFDSNHKNGDASIITSDVPPYISFHCFHDSCIGHSWNDARQAISGNDKIAKFFQNYDPNWKPKTGPASGKLGQIKIIPTDLPEAPQGIELPQDIDPMDFFFVNEKSKRATFLEERMAKYLFAYLKPLLHTDGIFYHYKDGVWKPFPEDTINKIITIALKERIKASYIDACKKVLAAMINREEKDWPEQTDLINVQNGMIDIKNTNILPHDPKYGSRAQLPVKFDLDAEFERWERFLLEVFPEENEVGQEKISLLQQFMGYCLLNTSKYEKCLMMVGSGGNGKSTILYALENVIGNENTAHLSLDELSYRFHIPYLQNKLVNMAGEIDPKAQVNTKLLKSAISGEEITGEHKHGRRVEFINVAKFIFAMNSSPGITERTKGLARRLLVLYFNVDFTERDDRDMDLKEYFKEHELDGIFMWMLQGAERIIQNNGFKYGEETERGISRFLTSLNPVMLFVEEKCEVDTENTVPCNDLHEAYCNWCETTKHRPMGRTNFYEQILMHWPIKKSKIQYGEMRRHCFTGIGLVDRY